MQNPASPDISPKNGSLPGRTGSIRPSTSKSLACFRGTKTDTLNQFADFNCLKLPAGKEFEEDFILLADIFPTGCTWHAFSFR